MNSYEEDCSIRSLNVEKGGKEKIKKREEKKKNLHEEDIRRQRMTRKVTKTTKRDKAWEIIGETKARGDYHNRWEREEME